MKRNLFITFFITIPFILQAADSASNRKEQTLRLGSKSGFHLMYLISNPFVIEIPGENWTFGLTSGSGKYSYSYTDSSTTRTKNVTFDTTEINGRYYIGNSFNIPFGYAMYKITWPDWVYSGVTYDLEYSINQLNIGIGNEWTYDWGGFLGIDWYQTGAKMSEEATLTLKSGTETTSTKKKATTTTTDIAAFSGALIFTFGFGF